VYPLTAGQYLLLNHHQWRGFLGRKQFVIAFAQHVLDTEARDWVVDPGVAQVDVLMKDRNRRVCQRDTKPLFAVA
jgi:hypothetical protein